MTESCNSCWKQVLKGKARKLQPKPIKSPFIYSLPKVKAPISWWLSPTKNGQKKSGRLFDIFIDITDAP